MSFVPDAKACGAACRRSGFTLLEVCLAMLIGLLLIAVAVPSISYALNEQRLRRSFGDFDAFVQDAKAKSVEERRIYVMSWDKGGITMAPLDSTADAGRKESGDRPEAGRFVFRESESYALERPAALMSHPAAEWMFWPSGVCEPVKIAFQGRAGKWLASYEPLTAHGVFMESRVR